MTSAIPPQRAPFRQGESGPQLTETTHLSTLLPSSQDTGTHKYMSTYVKMIRSSHIDTLRPNGHVGAGRWHQPEPGLLMPAVSSASIRYYVTTHCRDWRVMSTHLAFDALADGVRRSILLVIAEKGECSAGEIADSIERVGRTTVSSHLGSFGPPGRDRAAEGRHRYYSLDPEGPTREALKLPEGLLRSSLRN